MWARRFVAGLPWRRSSLRRRSDRIQGWFTLGAVVVTLAAGPWVAGWAGGLTYREGVRAEAWERAHHHPVQAVLVQDAPSRSGDGGVAPPAGVEVSAPARWTARDGTARSGPVAVAAGARAGSAVTVWIDEHGTLVLPPRRRTVALDAGVAATMAVVALAAFLGGVRRLVIWRLDRRRLRAWEAQWQIVGPRWSRR